MQAYVICVVLLCVPAAFGMFKPGIMSKFEKYRDDCIAKIGLTNTEVISKIRQSTVPEDGSADAFTICMLQTFHILNEDGAVNPNVSSYLLLTDSQDPREVAEICVPKSGPISGKKAVTIFKCLARNTIIVLP